VNANAFKARPSHAEVRARKAEISRRYARRRNQSHRDRHCRIGLRIAELNHLRAERKLNGDSVTQITNLLNSDGDIMELTGAQLGCTLNFTFDEYKAIGIRRGRHPSTIRPYDATKAMIRDYLKAHHRQRKAEARRRKRAEAAAQRANAVQHIADLDCRASALDAVVTNDWQAIAQLMKAVAHCPAFRTPKGRLLKGHSLRVAIIEVIADHGFGGVVWADGGWMSPPPDPDGFVFVKRKI
jgi:hypothetical protein